MSSPAVATVKSARRIWTERDQLRIFPLIEQWNRLGPRSAFEMLDELIGPDPFLADDVECLLRRYARLNPEHVAALDGCALRPPLAMIAGGKR